MAALASATSVAPFNVPQSSSLKLHPSYKFVPLNLFKPSPTSSFSLEQSRSSLSYFLTTNHSTRPRPKVFTAAQEVAEEPAASGAPEPHQRRKLYVSNFPWSTTGADLGNLFGECGFVEAVDIVKRRDGKSIGFAFVTMASDNEAQAVVDKFSSFEFSGRTIKVEFAKQFEKTRHEIFVSNLAWKVRSNHLRDFISANFKPISARVVFATPNGRSSGYGFVKFATEEEAYGAISALNGKELLGRPVSLQLSREVEKRGDEVDDEEGEEEISEEKPE